MSRQEPAGDTVEDALGRRMARGREAIVGDS